MLFFFLLVYAINTGGYSCRSKKNVGFSRQLKLIEFELRIDLMARVFAHICGVAIQDCDWAPSREFLHKSCKTITNQTLKRHVK